MSEWAIEDAADLEPRTVAIKAALVAQMPAGVPVYDLDEVPGSEGGPSEDEEGRTAPPARYVTFDLTRRWHSDGRGDADMIPVFALTTHYRAPNRSACRGLGRSITAALENRAYGLPDGDTVGPFSFEFDNAAVYVDNGWSGVTTWTL